jgi:CSLREA domain-containing protein
MFVRTVVRIRKLALASTVALAALGWGTAQAAVFTVNSVGDTPDAVGGDGVCGSAVPNSCTLRAAIQEANANGDSSNTINLSGISGQISVATALPNITKAVAINGTGASGRVTVSGNDVASLLRFVCTSAPCPAGGSYSISNLIVTDGATGDTAGGGGIYFGAAGTVSFTLSNVDVTSSEATAGPGGGIAAVLVSNGSTLTLTNVVIGATGATGPDSNGNAASGDGGGLWVRFDGTTATMTIENASVVNNTADGNGGGIAVARGRLNVYDTTLSANTATKGGGIYLGKTGSAGGSARIENVTISGNTAASGGGGGIGAAADNPAASSMTFTTIIGNINHGIAVATDPDVTFPGTLSTPFTSNIIAANGDFECAAAFEHSDTTHSGYNLTNEPEPGNSCGFDSANHDVFAANTDQLGLAALASNPSTPQTRALLAGSLAIDAGNPEWDTGSDQRGASTQDGGADGTPGDDTPVRDIGAYEFGGFGLVQFTLANYDVAEDTSPAVVTIKRYGTGTATATTPTVVLATTAGTATEGTCGTGGSDYTELASNPMNFAFTATGATQFEQTASFTLCNDTVDGEPDETFALALTEPATDGAGYDLGPISSGTVTIQDVENGVFAFDPTSYAEAEGSAASPGSATLTIKRTSGSDGAVRVSYASTSTCTSPTCTATANVDYTAVTSFVDFADGETSKTITVAFIGDNAYEGSGENFKVHLTGASCLGLMSGESCEARLVGAADDPGRIANVTITDTDAPLTGQFQFELASYTADEESGTLTVKVKRVGGTDGAVSVEVAATNGTASAGTDFNVTSPITGTLNWAAGDATDKTVTVTLVNELQVESNKDFTLTLGNPATSTGGLDAPTLGSPSSAAVTLVSGEQPAFQFTIPSGGYSQAEGQPITLTVEWDSFTGQDVTVPYFTLNGTAVSPVDYTGIPQGSPGSIIASAGDPTSKTFQVTLAADTAAEGNETFTANLGAPEGGGELGTDTPATVTIVDPAGARFTAASFTRADEQSGGTITATVERFGDLSQPFTVDFEIGECATAGCATQGDDFYRLAGTTGTLSWNANTGGSKTFTVNVQADTLIEGDESFTLALSNPQVGTAPTTTAGQLGLAAATAIIPDDDYRLEIVDVSPLAVSESGTQATITLQRVGSTRGAASVQLATANGTAIAGTDYTAAAPASTVTWGDTVGGTKTFNVAVTSDAVDELDETFTVTLGSPSTNLSGEASATAGSPLTVSITDDDTSVVSIAAASATEAANVTFAVSLSTPSDRAIVVTYDTANGTATAASDYTAVVGGQVSFAAGETAKNVAIATLGDTRNEADETFTVALSAPTNGAQVSGTAGTATGTIVDDDPVPALSVADATIAEGDNADAALTFVVSLSAASGRMVTVNVATADGTAAAPGDYTAVSSTPVTFAPGDISKNVTVTVKHDTLDELDETLTLTLSGATNATLADASATGTITDNDATPTLGIADVVVTEADATDVVATFTVTLSAASAQAVTVNYATANGTATAPADYTAATGTLTFAPGVTTRTIAVTVKSDAADEVVETFAVNLTAPTNATILDGAATGTVNDAADDVPSGGGGGGSWSWLNLWLLLPALGFRRRYAAA